MLQLSAEEVSLRMHLIVCWLPQMSELGDGESKDRLLWEREFEKVLY